MQNLFRYFNGSPEAISALVLPPWAADQVSGSSRKARTWAEVDAALHLATVTGLLVQPGSANGVSGETQALCVHSPELVTALGYAPVTCTFEQYRGMGSIPENALSPEDPVREIVTSRDVPIIARLA